MLISSEKSGGSDTGGLSHYGVCPSGVALAGCQMAAVVIALLSYGGGHIGSWHCFSAQIALDA